MASHLTLEEREVIAHMHRSGKCRRRSPTGSAAARAPFPANCGATAAATATGRQPPRGRPTGVGASGRGRPRCGGRNCGVTSPNACGSVGRQTKSPDARGATPPTTGGGRFRRPRFTPGFRRRRPAEVAGGVICGVWGESGRSGKNEGDCQPVRALRAVPLWWIAAVASATGRGTRSWAPIAAAGPSRWSSGSRDICCWARFPTCGRRPFVKLPPGGMRRRLRPCERPCRWIGPP